jgi:hypothetical protein
MPRYEALHVTFLHVTRALYCEPESVLNLIEKRIKTVKVEMRQDAGDGI